MKTIELEFKHDDNYFYVTCEFTNWNLVETPHIYLNVSGPFTVDTLPVTDQCTKDFKDHVLSLVMQEIEDMGYYEIKEPEDRDDDL